MKSLAGCVLWGVCCLCLPGMSVAQEIPLWEFGLRGGMDATGVRENYRAGEVYLLRELPLRKELATGVLTARLDLGLGYLESANDSGGWLAGGADLVWQFADGMVEIEAGFRPIWLMDHLYGNDDFGGDLQFSSHGGMALSVAPLVVNYRYQHISNAGVYDDNDGLDLHMFGLGLKF